MIVAGKERIDGRLLVGNERIRIVVVVVEWLSGQRLPLLSVLLAIAVAQHRQNAGLSRRNGLIFVACLLVLI